MFYLNHESIRLDSRLACLICYTDKRVDWRRFGQLIVSFFMLLEFNFNYTKSNQSVSEPFLLSKWPGSGYR